MDHLEEIVEIKNIFPNNVGIKNLDLSKLKISGENFKKSFESQIQTTLNNETLLDINSMNYLNIHLTDLLSHLLKPICLNFVFKLSNIWINKYDKEDYQGSHIHPAHYSFIIYYKTDKSHTVFNSPVKNLIESTNSKVFIPFYEPELKQGDIILFPSYLEHWVRPNSNNITISGNINITDLKK
tara:strand:+ start:32 stop:580 length:549 start_codon:yes stop_codon:yes gene_type:complete